MRSPDRSGERHELLSSNITKLLKSSPGLCLSWPVTSQTSLTGRSMTVSTKWWSSNCRRWRTGRDWFDSILRSMSSDQQLRAQGLGKLSSALKIELDCIVFFMCKFKIFLNNSFDVALLLMSQLKVNISYQFHFLHFSS